MNKNIKLIFLLLFFSVFLIGITSASLFQSNKVLKNNQINLEQKHFLNKFGEGRINNFKSYGTYEIHENGFLNLFRGDKVQEYTLLSSDNSVINAWAILEVKNYRNSKLLNGLSFKGGTPRDIKISYFINESYFEKKPIYKKVCGRNKVSLNGTINKNCNNVLVRTDKILKYKTYWKPYLNQLMPIGNYKIKINGKLPSVNKKVDWILNSGEQNQALDKWAWWDNSWNYKRQITGLTGNFSYMNISYYTNMNADFSDMRFLDTATETTELNYTIESYVASNSAIVRLNNLGASSVQMYYGNSGATTTSSASNTYLNPISYWYLDGNVNDALGINNGTNYGATSVNGNISGAYSFNSTNNDYINIPDDASLDTNYFTIFFKLNANSLAGRPVNRWGTIPREWLTALDVGSYYYVGIDTSAGGYSVTNAYGWETGVWHSHAITFNGTALNYYVDGGNVQTTTTTAGTLNANSQPMIFGAQSSVDYPFDGYIDEIGFYGRGLTSVQIQSLNNQTAPSFTVGSEQTNNGVSTTLNSPINAYNSSSSNILFNWTSTPTSVNLTNTTLYNWYSNGTILSTTFFSLSGNSSVTTTQTNNFQDGNYIWNAETCGIGVACSFASNRTFSIDTTPFIQFESPTNPNNTNISSSYIPVNVSLTETYFKNITFNFYKGSTTTSYSFTNSTRFINESFADGTYYYNVTTWTTTNKKNSTETRIINVDNTLPIINITLPLSSISYHEANTNLSVNWTVIDANLNSCWYNFNNINTSVSCSSNSSINITSANQNNLTFYANDTFGNLGSKIKNWSYNVFENSRTLNTTSYQTAQETYSINITANLTLTKVTLDYNGTTFTTTKSGTTYSKTMDIPTSYLGNHSIRWNFTYGTNTIYSRNSYQNILETTFALCNSTYTNQFVNYTFKDESDLSVINATIPSSTFIYWLGTGSVNKTLTFTNNSLNYDYTFCATPNKTLNVNQNIQYKSTNYPQRIFQKLTTFNGIVTNKILYLLSNANGIYVTYQVLDQIGIQISGVNVNVTRTISSETVNVGTGQTDAAGLITFWLNPDFVHTVTFAKTGYTSFTLNYFPTQPTYTVTLPSTSSSGFTDYLKGVTYTITPTLGTTLITNKFYYFNLTLNSTFWTLDSFGFSFSDNNGTIIGGNTTTGSSGTIINYINISNASKVSMTYYWIVNGTTTNGTSGWFTFNNLSTEWSIKTLFIDLSRYSTIGMFGLTRNGLNMIIFMVIFLIVGTMSFRFGLTSPASISGMVFAIVFLFDYSLGMINIGIGVSHFPTIFIGIITFGLVIREITQ